MQTQVGVYKALEKIGEGGMGEVYRGLDTMLEREVAIKQLRAEFAGRSDIVERFRTEAVTLGKLNHPNIVTLYSFLREGNGLYMVLEFVHGETLDAIIRRRGALPWAEAVALAIQALRGLEHAHQLQVIHRDLKPGNAILTPAGVLKLMDFGIARILNTARMTRVGHMVGTLEYMAPEQVRGGEGDARSDLYSLGIVLYELLAGRVPFAGSTDYELIKAQVETPAPPLKTFGALVPAPLQSMLTQALDKAPDRRFQSAGEFARALQTVLDQAAAPAHADRYTDGVGRSDADGGRARSARHVAWAATRMHEVLHSFGLAARPLMRLVVARVRANPMLALAATMVLIGLGLALAALSDRGLRADRNGLSGGGKAGPVEITIPGTPVTESQPEPAKATTTPSPARQPTAPMLGSDTEEAGGRPVARPPVRPPSSKPAPRPIVREQAPITAPADGPSSDIAEKPRLDREPTSAPPNERPSLPVAKGEPTIQAPSEMSRPPAPSRLEQSPVPPPPPQESGGKRGWQNAPVRK